MACGRCDALVPPELFFEHSVRPVRRIEAFLTV